MTYLKTTLLRMDWQGAVLPGAVPLVYLWEGHTSTIIAPLMRMGYPQIPLSLGSRSIRGVVAGEIEVSGVVVILMRHNKKDGFSSKIQIPKFGGKKGHPHDMADAFRQWAHCIMYYHDYYEDSYLMPLVVSSLTVRNSSVTPGGSQDLSMLLQMLREHYCGSFMFWEQRNMVKNLCQGACEDATDFIIRVGSSIGNLAKDLKGQLTEAELQSLQYEVSLNGVREEIWHILDSQIARHGQLTPHQMYEAVKRYETYTAHNKHLKGKSASPHFSHQRAAAQTSGYKPHFHKTTAITTSVEE